MTTGERKISREATEFIISKITKSFIVKTNTFTMLKPRIRNNEEKKKRQIWDKKVYLLLKNSSLSSSSSSTIIIARLF